MVAVVIVGAAEIAPVSPLNRLLITDGCGGAPMDVGSCRRPGWELIGPADGGGAPISDGCGIVPALLTLAAAAPAAAVCIIAL